MVKKEAIQLAALDYIKNDQSLIGYSASEWIPSTSDSYKLRNTTIIPSKSSFSSQMSLQQYKIEIPSSILYIEP